MVNVHYQVGTNKSGKPIIKIEKWRVDGTNNGASNILGGIHHLPATNIINVENLNNPDAVHDLFIVPSTKEGEDARVLTHTYSAPKEDIEAKIEGDILRRPIETLLEDKKALKTVELAPHKEYTEEVLKKEDYDKKAGDGLKDEMQNYQESKNENFNEFIQHNDDPGPGPGDDD